MVLIQQTEAMCPKGAFFRQHYAKIISDKHEDLLAKFGSILAQGIIDAGVCVYICMYVCMCTCMCVYMCACMCVCMCLCTVYFRCVYMCLCTVYCRCVGGITTCSVTVYC